jgi:hypothetical protein
MGVGACVHWKIIGLGHGLDETRATADFPIGSRKQTVWQGRSW